VYNSTNNLTGSLKNSLLHQLAFTRQESSVKALHIGLEFEI